MRRGSGNWIDRARAPVAKTRRQELAVVRFREMWCAFVQLR